MTQQERYYKIHGSLCYVYLYIDPTSDLIFYVGKGCSVRAWRHLHCHGPNKHLNHTIKKLMGDGIEPIIKIIECSTEQTAFDLEVGLIKIIGRRDLGTGSLLNLTEGGEGSRGAVRSQETKQRISESLTGKRQTDETKAKRSKSLIGNKNNLGNTCSVETRRKISISNTGKTRSLEVRQRISDRMVGNTNRLGRIKMEKYYVAG